MSDHFDTDDPRTDLTDLYAFPASVAGRTVLILCFNPDPADQDVPFDATATYELKIDTDGDAEADVAFHVQFSSSGSPTASVRRATGSRAREGGAVGDVVIEAAPVSLDGVVHVAESNGYRLFAGIRSDPHFKDVKGFQNDYQFTGEDPVALRDVMGVALEVPSDAISDRPPVRLWARTTRIHDGATTIIDQAGLPGTNNTWPVDDDDHATFSITPPGEQVEKFLVKFESVFGGLGYPRDEATEVARGLLPDLLTYDWLEAPGFPNGRRLTDDTADWLLTLLTRGRLTSDTVGPHTDLLDTFPYLGPPHLGSRS